MKRTQTLLFLPTVLCLAVALEGCASQPKAIPPDLSAAEVFQRAQDAADKGDYALAIRYYTTFRENNPNNPDRDIWALYEIAFNSHKMGKDATALALLDQLLKQYQSDTGNLPPAPRILALKLKERLVPIVPPPSTTPATASAPAATASAPVNSAAPSAQAPANPPPAAAPAK